MDKYNGMAVTFKKGRETHTIWGVRDLHIDNDGTIVFYMMHGVEGSAFYTCKKAKIVNVYPTQCDTCIYPQTMNLLSTL